MTAASFDVIIVGGGLAGATLARSLAGAGIETLVLERETAFKDRVRGEQMQPWGVGEAARLGIHDLLREKCGHDQPWVDMFLGRQPMLHRDLSATTPQQAPHFNFYHPDMQETLLQAAEDAGAHVRRGCTVRGARGGSPPSVTVEREGTTEELSARLIVGADGRTSMLRQAGGFEVKHDEPFLVIAGVLLDEVSIPDDTGLIYFDPAGSRASYLFPQGGGRARAYAAYPASTPHRLAGQSDWPSFVATSEAAGASPACFAGARMAGPLATFDAADRWVPHPYRDGIVLVGDAAASNDPAWGQGLSLTLRDVRVLRDALQQSNDWEQACNQYAREHDRHYGVIHDVTLAFKTMFLRSGAREDAVRARALPLIAQDPTRVPDQLFSGPDLPWDDAARRTFFAEDSARDVITSSSGT